MTGLTTAIYDVIPWLTTGATAATGATGAAYPTLATGAAYPTERGAAYPTPPIGATTFALGTVY